jgi:hypothetical protein
MPLDQGESIPRAAYVEGWLVVDFFGQVAVYSVDAGRWTDLTDELAAEAPGTLFPSGPIPAGDVLLFLGADSDGPRLLAYHPPVPEQEPTIFVPDVSAEGDLVRMPVTFPNGARATLIYPVRLQLARMGLQPDVSYELPGEGWSNIVFVHGRVDASARYLGGSEPIDTFTTSDGSTVPLWRSSGIGANDTILANTPYWLVHRTGDWTVLVGVQEGPATAAEVASSFAVHLDDSGLPWIEETGSLRLSRFFGESGGAQLSIGDSDPSPDRDRSDPDLGIVELDPNSDCDPAAAPEFSLGYYVSICLAEGRVLVGAHGTSRLLSALADGLQIEGLQPSNPE